MKEKVNGLEYDTLIKTPGKTLLLNDSLINSNPQRRELLKYRTQVQRDGTIIGVTDSNKILKR
jgi:hypothetical protein